MHACMECRQHRHTLGYFSSGRAVNRCMHKLPHTSVVRVPHCNKLGVLWKAVHGPHGRLPPAAHAHYQTQAPGQTRQAVALWLKTTLSVPGLECNSPCKNSLQRIAVLTCPRCHMACMLCLDLQSRKIGKHALMRSASHSAGLAYDARLREMGLRMRVHVVPCMCL